MRAPIPKPTRRKKNTLSLWLKTRKKFLQDRWMWGNWYKCEGCGRLTTEPEVDHILTRGSRPDLIHDLDNLRLYCFACHRKRHNQ